MPGESDQFTQPSTPIPADDLNRALVTARPDVDGNLPTSDLLGIRTPSF